MSLTIIFNFYNNSYRLLAAEAHYHVCVYSLAPYYGNAINPGAQIPFNYHLLIQIRKNELFHSVDRAIRFWFEIVPSNNTPNWVVSTVEIAILLISYNLYIL